VKRPVENPANPQADNDGRDELAARPQAKRHARPDGVRFGLRFLRGCGGRRGPSFELARQPIEALAEHGVRILHARIRGESGPPERVILKARLIVRDSCAPPEGNRAASALKSENARVKRLASARKNDNVAGAVE